MTAADSAGTPGQGQCLRCLSSRGLDAPVELDPPAQRGNRAFAADSGVFHASGGIGGRARRERVDDDSVQNGFDRGALAVDVPRLPGIADPLGGGNVTQDGRGPGQLVVVAAALLIRCSVRSRISSQSSRSMRSSA